jgi:cyclic-di-AMP phosphodiesterase PgpH
MSFFRRSDSARSERGDTPRRRRKTGQHSEFAHFLEKSRYVTALLFVLTAVGIGYLSFIGVSTAGPQLLPNQIAPMRIVSNHSFSYESRVQTERLRHEVLQQVPPVFRIDMEPYQTFSGKIRTLLAEINALAEQVETMAGPERAQAIQEFTSRYNLTQPHRVNLEDVAILLRHTDAATRRILFDNGLVTLREIYREGIYAPSAVHVEGTHEGFSVLNLVRGDGEVTEKTIQNEEKALQSLRINLIALHVPQEVSIAMFRIFRPGIIPNIYFDPDKTEELRERVLENIQPVVVQVDEGQTMVEVGMLVTNEQHEMLSEYRRHLASTEERAFSFDFNELMLHRFLLVLAVLFGAVIYIRIEDRETLQSNIRLAILTLVAILNLGLIWLIIHLGNHPLFIDNTAWGALLPFLAPYTLAPLMIAILLGMRPAIFMALMISFFAGIMFGNRVETFAIALLSSLSAIWFCQEVRLRKRVVQAGGAGGLIVAFSALLFGLVSSYDISLVARQMLVALTSGILTGVVVAGIVPVLEVLFKRTTDITLLELTDTNHPLLKRMQLTAPGTYHHSLVVANLAENAASAIGANPLLCRVCATFHDIGKLIKPEYFIENQREGINPHQERSPSFSALVIKSHVKDGVDLAVKSKLPRVVIDVIRQHHGTSLIQYFYFQAKQKEIRESEAPFAGTSRIEIDKVSESTYRYDGPRPQFRESAIIFFADSIEAASRTLKKVSPQNVDELIENIITSRIEDGQLDECPLTMQEIARIKKSFSYTLLNMLHSRVEYPSEEKGKGAGTGNDKSKKDSPAEPLPQAPV